MQDIATHTSDASSADFPPGASRRTRSIASRFLTHWPERVTREWALEGATGKGVRVCILDSGVDASHPLVEPLANAVVVSVDEDEAVRVDVDTEGDVSGHGTACAGIVRRLAPESVDHERPSTWLGHRREAAQCSSLVCAMRSMRDST